MSKHQTKPAKSHDDVLEEVAEALDIPESKYEEAKERYESLGEWLDREDSSISEYDPEISPQGSFLLGTVIRPENDADEYDVDLVCLLNGSKTEFTQSSLKEAVGVEIRRYADANKMKEPPEDGRRCWTLNYADDVQFHMDILPALPDEQSYKLLLEERGFASLARDDSLTGQAIAITDKTLPQFNRITDDWPQSNPLGYAAWFRSKMRVQLMEQKTALAKREMIMASVDDIPDYRVKTPLQRAIQLLKRHRDIMFADDGEDKPISIIITTLAAKSYNEEPTISAALQSIVRSMDEHIEYRDGMAWIANPVNPAENFADKWAEEPKKQENFNNWLECARRDFALYLRASSFQAVPDELREALGSNLVDRTLKYALGAPAIVSSTSAEAEELKRADAAIEDIQRSGPQSKPWLK